MAEWFYNHWELLLKIIISFGALGMLLKIIFSRPKVVFFAPRIGAGYEDGQVFCWYIPIMNEGRSSLLRFFGQREAAVDCRVKVLFEKPCGELIYNYAEWWDSSPIGKTLNINSPHEIVLAFDDIDGEVHLAGTPVKTANATMPPYHLEPHTEVIAHVSVVSRGKIIARSSWSIEIKYVWATPIHVKRLQ